MIEACKIDCWVSDEVKEWLKEAQENGAKYMFIGADHFSYDIYPVEVRHNNIRGAMIAHGSQSMTSTRDAFKLEDGEWKKIHPLKRYKEDQYEAQDGKWVKVGSKGELVEHHDDD